MAGGAVRARRVSCWSPPDPQRTGRPSATASVTLASLLAAFLVPNLPYLSARPAPGCAALSRRFSAGPSRRAGPGHLSLSLPAGGGSLRAYTVAAVVVLVATLACYIATYPVLKPAAFLLPSVVLFFATRSFGSYLVMLDPAAIAAAATMRARAGCGAGGTGNGSRGGGAAAVTAAAARRPARRPSPLSISIHSVQHDRPAGHRRAGSGWRSSTTPAPRVRPAFTIEDGMSMTAFWRRTGGPAVLGPHQRADYTIVAPSYFAMPSISAASRWWPSGSTPARSAGPAPTWPACGG